MLKYGLISSFRAIKRNLSFSLINISGLSLGLTLTIILFSWLKFEFSFDRFNVNANRIFRVVTEFRNNNRSDNFAGTPAPLGSLLKNEIPEISGFVRFGSLGRVLVNFEDRQFWENIRVTDPSVFDIFSFSLVSGNKATALHNPGSIIISETKAAKYFGSKNPLGQTLLLDNSKNPYIVTGVIKDIPTNSQIRFDFLCSFSELQSNLEWGQWNLG